MFNKILYVGAGCHIEPVRHFPNTKLFIFIDSQPRNEYDNIHPKYHKKFYKKGFCHKLEKECAKYGFTFDHFSRIDSKYSKKIISWKQYIFESIPRDINPTLLVFFNKRTKQTIRYYISTNIRRNLNIRLYTEIKYCDALIVSGYYPEVEILDIFDKPKVFIGYTNTFYNINPKIHIYNKHYDNNVIYYLQCNPNKVYEYFDKFYVINKETGYIKICDSYENFIQVSDDNYSNMDALNDAIIKYYSIKNDIINDKNINDSEVEQYLEDIHFTMD